MASALEDSPHDPVLVLIEDDEPTLNFDEWLSLISTDEPSEMDADAAGIIRELREHGER